MKQNVGPKERYIRLAVGTLAGIAAMKMAKSKKSAALLGTVAASGLATGASRYCPLSDALGIDNAH